MSEIQEQSENLKLEEEKQGKEEVAQEVKEEQKDDQDKREVQEKVEQKEDVEEKEKENLKEEQKDDQVKEEANKKKENAEQNKEESVEQKENGNEENENISENENENEIEDEELRKEIEKDIKSQEKKGDGEEKEEKEEEETGERFTGFVTKMFNKGRYGLIQVTETDDIILFYKENVYGRMSLYPNDHVSFAMYINDAGQNRAKSVKLIEKGAKTSFSKGPKGVKPRYKTDSFQGENVTCKFCNQSFSKQPILDQHILTKHPGAEEYLKSKNSEEVPQAISISTNDVKNLTSTLLESQGEQALMAWLNGLKLEEHLQKIQDFGCNDLNSLCEYNDEKIQSLLNELKLPLGPKKRFLRAVTILQEEKLKSQTKKEEENVEKSEEKIEEKIEGKNEEKKEEKSEEKNEGEQEQEKQKEKGEEKKEETNEEEKEQEEIKEENKEKDEEKKDVE